MTSGTCRTLQLQPIFTAVDMSLFPSSASLRGADVFLGPPGPHLSESQQLGSSAANHQQPPHAADTPLAHAAHTTDPYSLPLRQQQYSPANAPVSHAHPRCPELLGIPSLYRDTEWFLCSSCFC